MMKLEVPFYPQKKHSDCGLIALKMILDYFGENVKIEDIENKIDAKENKGIMTIQIAIGSAILNHKTKFYSKNISFNEKHLKKEFYKKYIDDNPAILMKKFINKAKKLGIEIEEKSISLDDILKFVTKNSLPIILLDWNIINKKKNYQGHFVPIVGYDDENVYVHNQGLNNPMPFMKIPRKIFDQARKSDGTDEDVVIIYRNKKNFVWEFTNQKKLTKGEFVDYFERKIFRTIRKYKMLPNDHIIKITKSNDLNTIILKKILGKKFKIKHSTNSNFSSENLSEIAEEIFKNVLEGRFTGPKPKDEIARPLYFHSNKEIELYAKLKKINGSKRKPNEKIRSLFETFLKKNQDLEINIVKALEQINL